MTKSEKLIDAVGFLDDDLIEEAERIRFNKSLRRTYSKPMRFAALAACCAMLIFGAFLFPRFFINFGNKSAQDAVPAAAEQQAVMAGGTSEEAIAEEETAETTGDELAEAKTAEKNETLTEEAVEEIEAMAETGQISEDEASLAYSGVGLLIWSDPAATATFDGVLYQAAVQKDVDDGIRGSEVTIDLFDLSMPAGTVSEASDQALVGATCYQATIDEVRYLLVEQPDGLYLFREKTE